jgi:hypothetical protein
MKLSNQKTFEKWCEKNGFRAGALLDDAERWASECDGTYGNDDIEIETGRTTKYGNIETIHFILVRAELVEVKNDDGEIIGHYRMDEPWTYGDDDYIDGTIEEAIYRF